MAPRVFQHSAPVSSSHEHPCTNRTTAHTANLLSSPASMSAQRHLQPISFHLQQPMSATAHSANQLSSPAANERTCINHINRINRTTVHSQSALVSHICKKQPICCLQQPACKLSLLLLLQIQPPLHGSACFSSNTQLPFPVAMSTLALAQLHTANLLSSPASMSAQRHSQPISFHLQQPMSALA